MRGLGYEYLHPVAMGGGKASEWEAWVVPAFIVFIYIVKWGMGT